MPFSASAPDLADIANWPPHERGRLLKERRNERGYTLEDLALTCGLTVTQIENLEEGDVSSPDQIARVAVALGLPR